MLSILIPVFNEEGAIQQTISDVVSVCKKYKFEYEVLAIDDGSTDGSKNIIRKNSHVQLLQHRKNRGYGASLKTGLRQAKGEWIAIIDADGTYRAKDLARLYQLADDRKLDMLVGDRSKFISSVPWYRRPGKAIISALVTFLLWQKVPDINSGLRVFRKDMALRFIHLYPEGFSFTTTITLASLTNNYLVEWAPVAYNKRIGQSQINFTRGLFHTFPNFIVLVIRITTYFKPLRFFVVPALLLVLIGLANTARTILVEENVTDASLLLLLAGLQIGLMGLVADVIVKSRR